MSHMYIYNKTYTRTIKLFTFNIKKNNLHNFTCYWDNTHTFNQRKHTGFKYKMSGYSFDLAVQNFFTLCFIYIVK